MAKELEFGVDVGKDYDIIKFLDLRHKIERVLEKNIKGLKVTDGGTGFGGVDLAFEYDSCRFDVQIKTIKED